MKSIQKLFQHAKSVSLLEWVSILFMSTVLTGLFGGLFFKHPEVTQTSAEKEASRIKEVEETAAIFNVLRVALNSAEHELTNNVQK